MIKVLLLRYLTSGSLRCGKSADVYSFSVILFEMFSDEDPFPGSTWEIFDFKRSGRRPEIPPNFPSSLHSVTHLGMSSEISERPKIQEFHLALEDQLQDYPEVAISDQLSSSALKEEMLLPRNNPEDEWSSDSGSSPVSPYRQNSGDASFQFLTYNQPSQSTPKEWPRTYRI